MSIIDLFLQSSITVKIVMISLILLSIYSWMIIFNKRLEFKKRSLEIKEVNKMSKKEWFQLKEDNQKNYFKNVIFKGVSTFTRQVKNKANVDKNDLEEIIGLTKENMEVAIEREIQNLKKNISHLATIGSVSPYIGLFGTVWGIMGAFISIGTAGQATLEYVAPSIAEALIATAIGLFAAIPAYISYNLFQNKMEEMTEEYQLLTDEFCLIAKENINTVK